MLIIRLQRIGRHNTPLFRAIVTDARRGPKSGKFIEIVGSYNPKAGSIELNKERIQYWLSVGAKTTDTVHNFLVSQKIIEGKKINALPKKRAPKPEPKAEEPKEEPKVETPAAPIETPAVAEEKVEEAPAEIAPEAPTEEAPVAEAPAEETPAA